jgi:hypothetical protein
MLECREGEIHVMTLAPCDPCGKYTRHVGPYFMTVADATLYAHYQCNTCGRVKLSKGRNPAGRVVSLQYVEPHKVKR